MLSKLNITSVLTVVPELKIPYDLKVFTHKVLPVEDVEIFDISQFFDEAVEFIRENLKTRNVLVHCWAGTNRSSTILVAYLIAEKKMDVLTAIKYARSKRRIIAGPSPGFYKQLEACQKRLAKAATSDGTSIGKAKEVVSATETSTQIKESKTTSVGESNSKEKTLSETK